MKRWPALLAAAFVSLAAAEAASGDYILSLVDAQTGATSATLSPGDTLALEVLLTGGPGDATDSIGFVVSFSRAGLTLTGFDWAAPEFETGGPVDFTAPSVDELPVTLTAEGITFSANTVAFGVTFTSGTLATIDLAIPASFPDGGNTITIAPDLILDAETFEPVPTAAGPPFLLTIGDADPSDDDGSDVDPGPDADDDGVGDALDAFPDDPTETSDTDADGTGDNADPDDDGDGTNDGDDAFPLDPMETTDTDADGTGDNADVDDDNDGVPDADDAFPLDGGESADSDGDGIGDNAEALPSTRQTGRRTGGGFCGAAMLAPSVILLLSLTAWRRKRRNGP